jgi:hypothetical protein
MNRTLIIATGVGLVAQLAMVLSGHYVEFIKTNVFAIGGMGISLVSGLIFGVLARAAWPPSLVGGLVAGGVCALLGIAVSLALGDVVPMILVVGTLSSAAAGLIGGALGKLLARRPSAA